jgi:hypothetical protein
MKNLEGNGMTSSLEAEAKEKALVGQRMDCTVQLKCHHHNMTV